MFDPLVNLIAAAVMTAAQALGGNVGLAIVLVSVAFRLALLPLTLRMARRARAQAAILERLRPELEELQKRFAGKSRELAEETLALYRRHGYRPLDSSAFLALAVQLPLFGGLYAAIARGLGAGARFLWVADLARPSGLIAVIAALFTYLSVSIAEPGTRQNAAAVVATLFTLWFAWRASAALALYWASSSLVGTGQSLILRRERRR